MATNATRAQLAHVLQIAGEVCITTPEKQNGRASCAYVDWEIVHRLRAAVAECGVDLKAARAIYTKLRAEHIEEIDRQRYGRS